MAAPTVAGLTGRTTTDSSISIALTIPGTAVAGQIIVANIVSSTSSSAMSVPPTDWNSFTEANGSDFSQWDYWCEVGLNGNNNANDTPTWTFTAAQNLTVRGIVVDGGAGVDASASATIGTSPTIQVVGPTTLGPDRLIISFVACDPSSLRSWTTSNGTATEQWDEGNLGADFLACASYTDTQAVAGSENETFSITGGDQEQIASRIAIAPATAGPAVGTATGTATSGGSAIGDGSPSSAFAGPYAITIPTMSNLSPVAIESQPHFSGPVLAANGTSMYFLDEAALGVGSQGRMVVYKSTDRGATWAATAAESSNTDDLEACSIIKVPGRTDEYMAAFIHGDLDGAYSRRFGLDGHATNTDAFIPPDTTSVRTAVDAFGINYGVVEQVSLCRFGAEDILLTYTKPPFNGNPDHIWAAVYDVSADTWGTPFVIDDETSAQFINWSAADSNNVAHIVYSDSVGNKLWHRTLTSPSTTPSARQQVNTNGTNVMTVDPWGSLVGTAHIGNTLHVVWFILAGGSPTGFGSEPYGTLWHNTIVDGQAPGSTPTQIMSAQVSHQYTGLSGADGPMATLVADGTDIYVLFSNYDASRELWSVKYNGSTWGTPANVGGNTYQSMHVTAGVLEWSASDRAIGIIAEDNNATDTAEGDFYYDELALPAAGGGAVVGTASGSATSGGSAVGDGVASGSGATYGDAVYGAVKYGAVSNDIVGTAIGSATSGGSATGSAVGAVSGTALGGATSSGAATGVSQGFVFGTATGSATSSGSASGSAVATAVVGTATGGATSNGSATGVSQGFAVGTATGSATSSGSATGITQAIAVVGTAMGGATSYGMAEGFDPTGVLTGPPPALIDAEVVGSTTHYTRRVEIYEADTTTLWMRDVPLVAGSVTMDQTRAERRSADVTLYNEDGGLTPDQLSGLWYDKVIKIFYGVTAGSTRWEASVGVFLIDRIATSGDGNLVKLSLRDKTKKLKFGLPYTLTYPENEPVENIIEDLAAEAGVGAAERNLPLTGLNTDIEITFERDKDRFTAMNELAIAHGYELYFDGAGVLQMTEFADPATDQPQYVFRSGAMSNLAKIDRTASDSLIRNHIVVYGEQAGSESPIWGEAFNTSPTSPTNISRLGLRTETYKSEWITGFPQAENLALSLLRYRSLEQYECNLDTVIIPWLEPGVTVELYDPQASPTDPKRFLLSSVTLNLDLSPASAVVKRITNVLESLYIYPDLSLYPDTDLYSSSGPGRVIWFNKVKRSWAANLLVLDAPSWFPERGSTALTIVGNPFTLTTAPTGHTVVTLPTGNYLTGPILGQRYGIVLSGSVFTVVAATYDAPIGSPVTLQGVIETNVALTAQEQIDLANWLTNEKPL